MVFIPTSHDDGDGDGGNDGTSEVFIIGDCEG